jgi:hypothetical protein
MINYTLRTTLVGVKLVSFWGFKRLVFVQGRKPGKWDIED